MSEREVNELPTPSVTLSDIAAGLEVTAEQQDRGVAVADVTERTLVERLDAYANGLPCTPEAAATLVNAYAGVASVERAAREAGIAPLTGVKVLHLLGEDVHPLGPTGRRIVRDWLDARLSRTDALELTGTDDAEFALAVFVEPHDVLPDAPSVLAGALAVEQGDPLADARSGADDYSLGQAAASGGRRAVSRRRTRYRRVRGRRAVGERAWGK